MNRNKEMMVRICALLGICVLTLNVNSMLHKKNYNKVKLTNVEKIEISKSINQDKYDTFMKIVNDNKIRIAKIAKEKEIKEQEKIKQLKKIEEDKSKADKAKANIKISASRGGEIEVKKVREVECHITFYTDANTRQSGGKYDKKNKLLDSHNEPICALPSDIPYGYYLFLDKEVNGEKKYKNVDTGGAIYWLNDEHTKMKVDIFIPDVTEKWLYNNTKKRIVKGWICKDN